MLSFHIPQYSRFSSRTGDRETHEFVKRAESVGVDFIAVHGRTRKQKSSEPVNLEAIRFVKEVAGVPVVANGDVFSLADAERIYEETGVNGMYCERKLEYFFKCYMKALHSTRNGQLRFTTTKTFSYSFIPFQIIGVMTARGILQNPALFAGHSYTPWECIEVRNSPSIPTTSCQFSLAYYHPFCVSPCVHSAILSLPSAMAPTLLSFTTILCTCLRV